jgi:uncharacterized protein (DUF111 family)
MLARRLDTVETPYGPIRVKVAATTGGADREGEIRNVAPEYDDCAAAAARTGVPLKAVQAAAIEAWGRRRT